MLKIVDSSKKNKVVISVLIALMICLPTGMILVKLNTASPVEDEKNLTISSTPFTTGMTGDIELADEQKVYRENRAPFVLAGDTLIVDDDGTGDYTSIQDAIDNAGAGDTIVVKDGTYGDQLTVYVSVTLVAASGETPTLYLSTFDVGLDVTAPDVLIEGFEIFGNGTSAFGPYPTIRASSGSDGLIVNDNDFKVFTGQSGQVALLLASGVTNVTFSNNVVTGYRHEMYHAALVDSTGFYYGSIQDAIDVAISDDTLDVAGGTYNERLVINKTLTLSGAYSGAEIFTILQPTDVPQAGVYDVELDPGSDGTIIQKFKFDFNGAGDTRGGQGIVVSDMSLPAVTDVQIKNNIIYTGDGSGLGGTGIQTGKFSDVSGLLVSGNTFYGDADGMGEGVYINPYSGDDVVINNNEFYGNLFSGISIEASNVTVSNNIVNSDVSTGIYGIRFIELTGGQTHSGVTISNNNVQNVTYGIRIGTTTDVGSTLTAVVESNNLTNNDVGIWIRFGANLTNSVHYNSIAGNINFGMNNVGNSVVNAGSNWWGNLSGPYHPTDNPSGIGDNVSDNVTFWPWYEFDGYSIPPVVNKIIGFPQAELGRYVSDETPFELVAGDDESGMGTLEYRIWNTTHRWGAWQPYTAEFTLVDDGKHMIEYNATDLAGSNLTESQIHYVDTEDPWVEVITPNGGEFIHGITTIRWNAADRIRDQEQKKWTGYWPLTEDYPGHIQSFIPTETSLNSVRLLLDGDDAEVTVILFSDITPVPIPMAQTSQHLQFIGHENDPEWIEFAFDSAISVDLDTTYYLGVTQQIIGNIGFNWYYFNATSLVDPYLYGQSWLKKTDVLESHPEWDWCFRTSYWEDFLFVTIEYSTTGGTPWSTLATDEYNDGEYTWDTSLYSDGESYRIRVLIYDVMNNLGNDDSDSTFSVDNTGPTVSNVFITDTTIDSTEYTKDGDNLEITAMVTGDPVSIEADLSGFGKGSATPASSYDGTTARWAVFSIACSPADGEITVTITAQDPTGDTSGNSGSIIADNTGPAVDITRPEPGLYLMDSMRLLPYPYPLIIGQITLRADANDIGSGVDYVEFYLEDKKRATIPESPYEWLWDEAAIGFFNVKVIAYDNVGYNATAEIEDLFILNLDIFGHQPPP